MSIIIDLLHFKPIEYFKCGINIKTTSECEKHPFSIYILTNFELIYFTNLILKFSLFCKFPNFSRFSF